MTAEEIDLEIDLSCESTAYDFIKNLDWSPATYAKQQNLENGDESAGNAEGKAATKNECQVDTNVDGNVECPVINIVNRNVNNLNDKNALKDCEYYKKNCHLRNKYFYEN